MNNINVFHCLFCNHQLDNEFAKHDYYKNYQIYDEAYICNSKDHKFHYYYNRLNKKPTHVSFQDENFCITWNYAEKILHGSTYRLNSNSVNTYAAPMWFSWEEVSLDKFKDQINKFNSIYLNLKIFL